MEDEQAQSKQRSKDFFISYTGKDRAWAEWIALQLEEAGYHTIIQAWDFRPGSNFVAEMDDAAKRADRTLLVLSPAYLASDYAFTEWAAAFRHGPRGKEGPCAACAYSTMPGRWSLRPNCLYRSGGSG